MVRLPVGVRDPPTSVRVPTGEPGIAWSLRDVRGECPSVGHSAVLDPRARGRARVF